MSANSCGILHMYTGECSRRLELSPESIWGHKPHGRAWSCDHPWEQEWVLLCCHWQAATMSAEQDPALLTRDLTRPDSQQSEAADCHRLGPAILQPL